MSRHQLRHLVDLIKKTHADKHTARESIANLRRIYLAEQRRFKHQRTLYKRADVWAQAVCP